MNRFEQERRRILQGLVALGAGGVLTACGGGSSGGSSSGSNPSSGTQPIGGACGLKNATIPLSIDASVNATGIPADIPIRAYITGLVKVPGQVFYRYDAQGQKPVQMATADNTITDGTKADTGLSGATYQSNYPSAWADYSIPLDRNCATVIADLASFNTTNIPGFGSGAAAFSGRIWISIGQPNLPFTPRVGSNPNGAGTVDGYTTPVVQAGGPGSLCLYDWLEFSYSASGELFINTTQVDQFGFPISIQATGSGAVTGGVEGVFNTSRSKILATLAAIGNPLFNTQIAMPTTGVAAGAYPPADNTSGILRALAPSKTSRASTSTYLDSAITAALTAWQGKTVQVSCPSNALQPTYYGRAAGTTLNFYTVDPAVQASPPAFSFNDITTFNVLDCNGTMTGVDVPQTGNLLADLKNTGKALLAGFNRGVIGPATTLINIDDASPGTYQPPLTDNFKTPPFNTWVQQFHQFNTNGLAYGFAYDDVGDQEPLVHALGTTSLQITLGQLA